MNRLKIYLSVLLGVLVISSCESILEPDDDNHQSADRFLKDPAYAEGILLNAYTALGEYTFEEAATDDAVNNINNNSFSRLATGEWSSKFNPLSKWSLAYKQLFYINTMLEMVDQIEWSYLSETRNELFKQKHKGESYALRAMYNFELLKNHGGIDVNGDLKGFVILNSALRLEDDWNLPRDDFDACVNAILSDCDQAISLLPDKFETTGDPDNYDAVFGPQNKNRINATIVEAFKSRVALWAASPAFNLNNANALWQNAAQTAGAFLQENGGLDAVSSTGHLFYNNYNDADIIWRNNYVSNNGLEKNNFPPSLFGDGKINPTQNLVDAFPMANGYPIEHASAGFDAENPYTNRDPRLSEYILYNGNDLKGRVITTDLTSETDGVAKTSTSTKTGYYLKKLLSEKLNIDPTINAKSDHWITYIRFTEIFLNYAEAANEAYGPDNDPGFGFSAKDVILALRARGGISQPDEYVSSVSTKEQMRELIRNERRIELCFEGFRFWDIRRWKYSEAQLNEMAKGVNIDGSTFNEFDVEERNFRDYMIYGPLPEKEIIVTEKLLQNKGW